MSKEADRIAAQEALGALSFNEVASTLLPKVSVSSQPVLASHIDETWKVECEKDIPKWFEDDSDEEDSLDEEKDAVSLLRTLLMLPVDPDMLSQSKSNTTASSTPRLLETFAEDVSALILSHLSLDDISSVSQVSRSLYAASRSNTLWKFLMDYRWNVPGSNSSGGASSSGSSHRNQRHETSLHEPLHYFTAYQQAHAHPHDLWITHWNCSFPCDGLAPGRCCIPADGSGRGRTNPKVASESATCDICQADDSGAKDQSRFRPSQQTSRRAFRQAATFQRRLSLTQYHPGPTHFLSDLLFFNLSDPATALGQWELEQGLGETTVQLHHQQEDAAAGAGADHPLHETSHHSWHVVQLSNPDFSRAIIFQIGVQRPDCFTVYPSEGYIPAGGTVNVTVGVRPLGSALAYAFEALNVQRDGLDLAWADLYTEQAHLPLAPYVVRYRFAAMPPHSGDANHHPRRRPQYQDDAHKSSQQLLLDYHWKQDVPAHQIRSIHLSAHVHAHYSWEEFARAVRRPWNLQRDNAGPLYVTPVLQETHPDTYQRLVRNHLDLDEYLHHPPAWMSQPCGLCGHLPGSKNEKLAQAYLLSLGDIAWYREQRRVVMENIVHCLRLVGSGTALPIDANKLPELLFAMHGILNSYKAAPWTGLRQKRILVQLEALLDDVSRKLIVNHGIAIPWRLAGVYRYALCTDSVFGGPSLGSEAIDACWKDEPEYLDAFRHLAHNPGRFCLGPQEDPNHLNEPVVQLSKRYARRQVGVVTDAFMDDPISALQASICMMQDPRSLLVHGIYDRVAYPGTIVHRPRIISPQLSRATSRLDVASVFDLPWQKDSTIPENGEPDPDDITSERPEAAHHEPPLARIAPRANARGPRFLQVLWMLGAQLGLAVIDRPDTSCVFIDRNILIASQWVNISLMAAPLFCTLFARYFEWIPAQPVDYNLEDLPFEQTNKVRFLTARECGQVSMLLLFVWLALGRWTERYTSRDFFRVMLEHITPLDHRRGNTSRVRKMSSTISLWFQRRWDAVCPLFLQRRVFTPHWNRRTSEDLMKHIAFWRSRNLSDQRSMSRAIAGHGSTIFADSREQGLDVGTESSARKLFVGSAVALGSFSSSTPHFWLNLVTVFSCSISLGMSVSLHSMEKGRSSITISNNNSTGSMLKEYSLVTIVILAFLIGQLVGSSGGVLFLAEFIVTFMMLVLGGAGTISASAMESWGCFFCLSTSAFWGYLFGRVALMDGIRQKRGGYASVLLSKSVAFLCCFWIAVFFVCTWDSPISLVIVQPSLSKDMQYWNYNHHRKQVNVKHLLQ
jgi:hypothetical protein